jgi:SAM-dependent methyltransferase
VKLSHKIAKATQPLTYKRAWRKLRRNLHPIPLAPLLAQVDQRKLANLRERHIPSSKDYVKHLQHYVKYLDVERHLKLNIARAQDLNLHRSPPGDVLDIGCGGGFFLFILKHLGHRGLGLDTDEIPLFADLVDLLHVDRNIHEVRPFQRLPDLGRKFDWITSFSTAFHGVEGQSWRWGVPEWEFFVADLQRHLRPGGRIFFGLNPSYGGNFYTPEIHALFLRHGARVERENVLLPPA